MTKRSARDKILWHAYDLFGTHCSISCPSCGQSVRDGYGERRENRLRKLLELIHEQHVPQPLNPPFLAACESFIDAAAELASHALGRGAGKFVAHRLTCFVEGLADD